MTHKSSSGPEKQRFDRAFLLIQLAVGLLWVGLLPQLGGADGNSRPSADSIRWILLWTAWCPTIATAAWQARGRSWWQLVCSDAATAGILSLLALTIYVPILFTQVVWILPFALLPRGCIAAVLTNGARWSRRWR
ncbi:hypothetical protein [Cyanobium sp. HWJ4-Hawea]|uniref:hypothetical protein n=1 Tax=Cyanobium sp. HWJ4-Hawea TaxID=2823713 RepID=UPI0020CC951B|nr:hypothetical protein [Cyanobium sp. HWJ4-Hawea]